jgi:hypothetical protein
LAINHSFFGIEKTSKSQRDKLRKIARKYIHETVSTELDSQLKSLGVSGYHIENVTHVKDNNNEWRPIDSDKDPTVILLHYPSILETPISYIPPRVKIEISCLSMDEPTEDRDIHSLIEESFHGEDSGANCSVRTVLPTRTFLEKIFLLAEEFQKENPRSERMSRHLYDLEKLMDTPYGHNALADHALYNAIVEHRRTYYAQKHINYDLLSPSSISFIVPEELSEAWRADYANLREFFIYGSSLEFDDLIQRIKELHNRVHSISNIAQSNTSRNN